MTMAHSFSKTRRAAGVPRLMLWIALGFALTCASPALASEQQAIKINLSFAQATQPPLPVVAGELILEPSSGAQADRKAFRAEVPGRATIEVGEGLWRVELRAEGFWAAPLWIQVPADTAELLTMPVIPTGLLQGTAEVERGETLPKLLTVRFESSSSEAAVPRTLVDCPIEGGRWSCELPAGPPLDLRIRAQGFVSHHKWDFALPTRGVAALGRLPLKRGATVVGWMASGIPLEKETSLAEVGEVELFPLGSGQPPADNRLGRLALIEKPTERGFFHFQGVPPGSYRVVARLPGLAPAEIFPVTVMENAETELRDTLELLPPLTLEVQIQPNLDLFGAPWKVDLLRVTEIPGSGEDVPGGLASQEGIYRRQGLSAGTYLVLVSDSEGSRMGTQEHQLSFGQTDMLFALPVVWIEGKVSLGSEPVPANVVFGGRHGASKVQLLADEEGFFTGYLPRPGSWRVWIEETKIGVRRNLVTEVGESTDGPAWVDLALPDTRVAGEVLDEAGDPVENALVRLKETGSNKTTSTTTGEDGIFELRGVSEGPARLHAGIAGAISDEMAFEIEEDRKNEGFRLVLRDHRRVTGVLSGSAGPIPGAAVWAVPYKNGLPLTLPLTAQATTDVRGQFALELPSQAEQIQITAFPPGYALTALPPGPVPEEPLELRANELGGELVLELAEPLDWKDDFYSPKPAVLIDGIPLSFWVLENWRRAQGRPIDEENGEYGLGAMPQGSYKTCLTPPASVAVSMNCPGATGYLSLGGTLTLSGN